MTDIFLKNNSEDLYINETGDISLTESVCQAVRIRLKWFLNEWRLGPTFGLPYFEDILVKNPNEAMIQHLITEKVMEVKEVTSVDMVEFDLSKTERKATIKITFSTDEDTYEQEVTVSCLNTA